MGLKCESRVNGALPDVEYGVRRVSLRKDDFIFAECTLLPASLAQHDFKVEEPR